jgi:hypothetical protein
MCSKFSHYFLLRIARRALALTLFFFALYAMLISVRMLFFPVHNPKDCACYKHSY